MINNDNNDFSDLLSPDKVQKALLAADQPLMIDSDRQLADASEYWKSAPILGLDTEFVRERTYRADLGLLQISDGKQAWLIDPLKIKDATVLQELLTDTHRTKVLHSGSEDFEVIHHHFGVTPLAVIDTQIACAMLGESLQLGYHHAVKKLFDVEIDKDQTRSNWLKRPLSSAQCRYAALDVVLLPMMAECLQKRLSELQRSDWLSEDVERMARKSLETVMPEDAWKRIRGIGSLDASERKVLKTLAGWREITASNKNLARGFVIKDSGLLQLTRLMPESMTVLDSIEDIHPKARARYGETWLGLIGEALDGPEVPPPPLLDHSHKNLMKTLRARVADYAEGLNVDAALLASRKQLEQLVLSTENNGDVPERFTGWRKSIITDDLLEILHRK